ncbi:hypothetical protein SA496_20215 [Pseudomonas sp. JS3066]|uniref:hypothetical protein n=1 Tax=Pseudomonas sp. JS3066 TaxID=3090665 RepID=UPI002E7C24A7|nr:hypothetical protein [Pseudomonas sp. JS3066]WVK92027.1 hypothetical protein SA496_20215 [Pseudomonas sp. JS3066]
MTGKRKGLTPLKVGLLTSMEEIDRQFMQRAAEKRRILFELADGMGIPETPYREHATLWALVERHVPEFKERKPDGAKAKWTVAHKFVLVHSIALLMRAKGCSKAEACDLLAEARPSWLPKSELRRGGEALARQCPSRALKSAQEFLEDAESLGRLQCFFDHIFKGIDLIHELEKESTEKSSA